MNFLGVRFLAYDVLLNSQVRKQAYKQQSIGRMGFELNFLKNSWKKERICQVQDYWIYD